jgi:penicillin amidase
MTRDRRRRRAKVANVLAALLGSALILDVLGSGAGPVPALGKVLDPGRGVWASASGGTLPRTQALRLAGMHGVATVAFSPDGMAAITAPSDWDAFLAMGYVQAAFRLTEMDLSRRLGEGLLAQLTGGAAVSSDRFELQLGLLRTARAEWASTPRSGPAGQALTGYAQGVNDWLGRLQATGQWPALFTLTGVYPRPWTPVDSLVIQETLTQELSFTTTPLDEELLTRSLGAQRMSQWFPVLPPGTQRPYDPGPYRDLGVSGLPAQQPGPVGAPGGCGDPGAGAVTGPAAAARSAQAAEATAVTSLLREVSKLPAAEIHRSPDSNAWAVNGPAVAGGTAMLAGDPHLPTTLPSVWYEISLQTPDLDVSGVSVAGLPAVLLGHNRHIAWSLTDVQNQSAIFYAEQTSPARPGQYCWRGRWRQMGHIRYVIPVRGGPPAHLDVSVTVHGPVLTEDGQTVSVFWTGNIASPDLAAILGVDAAADFRQFRSALAAWHAPTQNFVYADDRGNIGAISAGYYPVVARGDPWLPLPGDGRHDVIGTIPYPAVPQAYDPASHVIATANQRPVGPGYPYYIGTAEDFFDPGYRSDEIYRFLVSRQSMTPADFAALQHDVTDRLAAAIVPRLLAALTGTETPVASAARAVLRGWDYSMSQNSAAASIWWEFWDSYLSAVFQPWWKSADVPVRLDSGLGISALSSLGEDLAQWTAHDQANPAFTPPGSPARTAAQVMRLAFEQAVRELARRLGGSPQSWTWGRLHSRVYPSLTQAAGLGYGPRPDGGDPRTVDAADGGLQSSSGPSWRMIITWPGTSAARAEGIYPGGQSENPASPWYQDQFRQWWSGNYLPFPSGGTAGGQATWTLESVR